ncbi:MAG: TlpA family protein disulfide reductase, partial [Flavobacteriaceae bacterium]|nr:TlpA family protein disulfide reductase [Flavobacteriaceae bacterium]
DTVLSNSSFINDRLTDYVFYLNQANDQESKNTLHKKAITDAVNKVGDNPIILKNFEESLLQNYVELENNEMVNFVMNNFYNNLPDTYQDAALQFQIAAAMKTAIGKKATDFSWEANGHTKNLYSLIGQDYYIVVFFSSGCPHCQVEIPEFHNFIKEIENIKVISIGLEDEKEAWEKMTENYNEFTNILDLDKWNSQKVKDYGITAIPSYFVLDANKNILAKPNDFEELKTMFETK